ncbi:hypothetical protein G3N95_18670 [Paraburkholderia sp. Tr-20389]|uniref:type III secretion protein HrpB4 n=1 Tax=Paraburkholderia sp. Tr-20389 TaxID=2703903 RepID=UPI00197D0081|nr:type III secretion protein HrpB4 [Paraburkholderia sp. Tr-20389]MBN3754978.1 hypothetical protein [Paraburkholderia sp. Tr-20389]
MTRVSILALSRWAHHSWLPRGERARSERAQADANASLLELMPQLASARAIAAVPQFAVLPRPACAKVMRVAASLAHAHSLRKVVSATARESFASRVAPHVLRAIQSDARAKGCDAGIGPMLDVFDRMDMTAAGLRIALHAHADPALHALIELRLPRAVAQRASHFRADDLSPQTASGLLDAAYVLGGGQPC